MGFFSRKHGNKEEEAPPAAVAEQPNGNRIRFDPELVPQLENDHIELKKLYTRIGELLNQQHYTDISPALTSFKTRLQAHIMVENVRFYVFLEKELADDSDAAMMMRNFHQEMNGIARKVVNFTKKYAGGVTATNHNEFKQDYKDVGAILQQRLVSEENDLYPLYKAMAPH